MTPNPDYWDEKARKLCARHDVVSCAWCPDTAFALAAAYDEGRAQGHSEGFDSGTNAQQESNDRAYFQGWEEAISLFETAADEARQRGKRGYEIAKRQWKRDEPSTLDPSLYGDEKLRRP